MNTRSAVHQKHSHTSRARSSSSQARSLLYGWTPETEIEIEREPNQSDRPPLSHFTRGLPKRNRTPSGQRPPTSTCIGINETASRLRSLSLVEKVRVATTRRPSASSSTASHSQGQRKRQPSLRGAAAIRQSSYDEMNRLATRKRGPSLVIKARELMNQPRTQDIPSSFRRLPGQLSRHDESASENEKARLSIEAVTPCFNLVQRWKDPNDWLQPSNYWKKTHPAMNFRLWRVVARNPRNDWELKASAERNLEEATRRYRQKGGDGEEWWREGLEEEVLDEWSLSFGGQDPPRSRWGLEG